MSIIAGRLYRHWRRLRAADNVDAYVRGAPGWTSAGGRGGGNAAVTRVRVDAMSRSEFLLTAAEMTAIALDQALSLP